jgi:hypothetical protein
MTLKNYFTLIIMSIFQRGINKYQETYFNCPMVICKDGFNISLQISNGNYCSSENGYRELGIDWQEVEFGFPSKNDKDIWIYSEKYNSSSWDSDGNEIPFNEENFDVTDSVGMIPIDVIQNILNNHGGIDWSATLSNERAERFIDKR